MIETVNGPIEPDQLGVTLAHEHLFIDLRCLFDDAADAAGPSVADQPVSSLARSQLEYRPYRSRDNLVLDDEETAAFELAAFREAGGQSLIDLTVDGIAPNPSGLRRLAKRTGIHVIAGTGVYVAIAHPSWVAGASVDELAARFIKAIRVGIGDTGIKAGVLGELGTSSPIHPDEVKVLKAAARAHHETGVPINVHCALWAREGLKVLDVLEAAGVDLRRVALSHMDELLDFDYHRRIAERGAWLSLDTWGSSFDFGKNHEPTDGQRLEHLLRLIDAGFGRQLLLAHDACTKLNLRQYGGKGIAYLLTDVPPQLARAGASATLIRRLLVDNPRRFLVSG